MEREIAVTKDGSKTLFINELNENYHSHYGALQEAEHVFIKNGLNLVNNYEINILELGFGTGLNVLVTINEYLKTDKNHIINYFTLEKYPINDSEVEKLAYFDHFDNPELKNIYQKIHQTEWEKSVEIVKGFHLKKIQCDFFDLENIDLPLIYLVYFDCFGARVQPDLWEQPLFKMVSDKMNVNGLLTTYSSKGSVRRILKELNFNVEKKQGPPGKREMINAIKL
ncbi:tRNA 5-methylaminomethyl-2-thiouridine biosynthesis bifunctional protein MnmC [Chryseobacterium aquaeductus]|uniref:tRNA 5-methylaminomethyl-2-thiouridine biosynthesis bifunctional protein MnmC n=1 Tax=Chryseobacterium aquaeductus TaxID=2675056 RepID=A0A9N8MJ54_9FLAO|nr:tRNA (5-methylaminomethyl-2-thiouridine)(34)-methyltransferase MnmD [Chryseobacterium aquaeductus]CAA7332355.1 tRNA 5-methylaminomethyl-2-thiouridine biosynthesis bifunctional protein MnmC [Chryseobacterium potabilaquae]CAD7815983.1 tRNA 5-methylaminomethyl-2-thiouridine biosynthesis bifunctional protein MnmC [Chryseobacterium aquaeductus]